MIMDEREFIVDGNEESQIDLTPMLDVVFIMLIFFIVTSTFVAESGLEVSRPGAETAVASNSNSIQIGISANSQIFMDMELVDKRVLRARIERGLAENPGAAVIIVADSDSTTATLIEVMDQARKAGASDISIAADEIR